MVTTTDTLSSGTDNLFGRFLAVIGGRATATVIAVVSTPIIVRLLGPGGYGDYAVMLSIFSLFMIPVSGSITEGVQKFVAESRDRAHWREDVIRVYGLLGLGIAIVAAGLLLAFTALGGPMTLFEERFSSYFYLLVGLVVASQFRAFTHHVVLGFGLEQVASPLGVAKKAVTVGLGITLVLVGYGVSGMLAGHIAANVGVAVVAGFIIVRNVSLPALLKPDTWTFPYQEVLSFNSLNILLVLMSMSLYHVDVIMLGLLGSSEQTGFYKAALSIAEFLWLVPIALQAVLLHSSSRLWSDGQIHEITQLASRVTRYTVLLGLLVAIVIAVIAEQFIPLYYGAPFVASVAPLLLLLPGTVGFAAARPLKAISQGSGRLETVLVAAGIAAGVNVVLNAALIPIFGMNGAAVATSIGYGSMFVTLVWAARRIGYEPLQDIRAARIGLTGLVASPLIVLFARTIDNPVLACLLVPPFASTVYLLVALRAGALTRAEIIWLLEKLLGSRSEVIVGKLSGCAD